MKAAPVIIAGAVLIVGYGVKRFCAAMPTTHTFGHAGTSRKVETAVEADIDEDPGDWFQPAPELAHGEWG